MVRSICNWDLEILTSQWEKYPLERPPEVQLPNFEIPSYTSNMADTQININSCDGKYLTKQTCIKNQYQMINLSL